MVTNHFGANFLEEISLSNFETDFGDYVQGLSEDGMNVNVKIFICIYQLLMK